MTPNYSNLQPQHEAAIQIAIADMHPFTLVDVVGTAQSFFTRYFNPHHTADAQCIVDPSTDCCIQCGAGHGYPCGSCGGRAFHTASCSIEAEWDSRAFQDAGEAAAHLPGAWA